MANKKVKPIPDGYHSITPVLIVNGAAKAIDFYKRAFGAIELYRMEGPNGHLAHAELDIGGSRFMLSDEWPQMKAFGPQHWGGSPQSIHLYLEDVDATVKRAVAAGAALQRPVENQFYGDRTGSVTDPFGHVWHVATHVEDVPPEEKKRRSEEWAKKNPA